MNMKHKVSVVLLSSLFLGFTACENVSNNGGTGTLKMSITDDPFPIEFVDSANVVITKVEIRNAEVDSANPYTVIMEDTMMFNLIELRNGVSADLLESELPAGEYDLIRVYVESASISLSDGNTYNLKVPSGAQTGIKVFIDPPLAIAGGLTAELLLDVNLDKSFVMQGNMNTPAGIKGFHFKPVLRVANLSVSGTLEGWVSDTSAVMLENAEVWIESDSVVSTAFTDSLGYYAMPGLPAGSYDFFATMESHDTVMVEGVEIIAGNRTRQDAMLTPQE